MNYSQAIEYIEHISWTDRSRGLHRIKELLKLLDNPQDSLKVIHIAGTNGKGSTASMLESIFRAAGYKTGLFTSPHLLKYNERIRVNNIDIRDDELVMLTEYMQEKIACMSESPTVFELLTAIGFEYFKRQSCDIVILETGMGGEFDSTNVVDKPVASVITAIGFDHMAQLGNTLPEIASAKAGIIKQGRPLVVLDQSREILEVFRKKCFASRSAMFIADYSGLKYDTNDMIRLPGTDFTINPGLKGQYQLQNISLVLKTIETVRKYSSFEIADNAVTGGLTDVSWAARFEILSRNPDFILDGAHNPHGIRGVTESLKARYFGKKIIYIVGILADKNVEEMTDMLCQNAGFFITLTPDSSRALSNNKLAELIRAKGFEVYCAENVRDAVEHAYSVSNENDVICSLGSLYLAGSVREYVVSR